MPRILCSILNIPLFCFRRKAETIARALALGCCLTLILLLGACGGKRSSVKGDPRKDVKLRERITSLEKRLAEMEKKTKELETRKRTVPIFIGSSDVAMGEGSVILKETGPSPRRKARDVRTEVKKGGKAKAGAAEGKGMKETDIDAVPILPIEKIEKDSSPLQTGMDTEEKVTPESSEPVEPRSGEEKGYLKAEPSEKLPGEAEKVGDEEGKDERLDRWREEFHFQAGIVHQSQLKLDDALAEYRKALELNPDNAFAHYNIGTIYEVKGKDPLAIKYYKTATEFHPYYAEAFLNLGALQHKRGKYEEALKNYRQAVSIDENLSRAYVGLANICEKYTGEPEQAILYYRKYIDSCKDPAAEELVTEKMDELKKTLRSERPRKKERKEANKNKRMEREKIRKK